MADAAVLEFVESRAYRVIEINNVLARRIVPDETFARVSGCRKVADTQRREWSRVVSEGFSENMPVSEETADLMGATCNGAQCRRLAAAQQQGCDVAMASVLPGSASHRNYERAGFELVYIRMSFERQFYSASGDEA